MNEYAIHFYMIQITCKIFFECTLPGFGAVGMPGRAGFGLEDLDGGGGAPFFGSDPAFLSIPELLVFILRISDWLSDLNSKLVLEPSPKIDIKISP